MFFSPKRLIKTLPSSVILPIKGGWGTPCSRVHYNWGQRRDQRAVHRASGPSLGRTSPWEPRPARRKTRQLGRWPCAALLLSPGPPDAAATPDRGTQPPSWAPTGFLDFKFLPQDWHQVPLWQICPLLLTIIFKRHKVPPVQSIFRAVYLGDRYVVHIPEKKWDCF